GRRIVFFCAFGERSAMAVAAAKDAGLANTAHIAGGIDAWKKAGGPVQTGCGNPTRLPSLRGAKRRSNPVFLRVKIVDCFASLAMTTGLLPLHPLQLRNQHIQ